MIKPKISIIIVNLNGRDYLEKCLPSIRKEVYANKEIVLVDNASTDGSIEYSKKIFPNLKVVRNKCNLGFALANNLGLKVSGGKYIFLLNNDTIIPKNVFGPLVDYLENHSDVYAIQPRVRLIDKPDYLDSVGSFFTNSGFLYHLGFGKRDSKNLRKETELFSAKGCALMIRKSILKKSGLFDNDFFAYFEETDFCWRLWLMGGKVVYFPFIYIFHKGSGTASKMNFEFINYHSYKNRICSLIKNLGPARLFYSLPLHLVFCLTAFGAYLFTGKIKGAFSIIRAIGWNIINLKKTLSKRDYVQKNIRIIKDYKFLPNLTRFASPRYFYYLFNGLEKY